MEPETQVSMISNPPALLSPLDDRAPDPSPAPKAQTSREGRAEPSAGGSALCQVDTRSELALAHLYLLANPPVLQVWCWSWKSLMFTEVSRMIMPNVVPEGLTAQLGR